MGLSIQQFDKILDLLHAKSSLSAALKSENVNSVAFFDHLERNPNSAKRYALAQQARAELLVEELIDIADNATDQMKARNQIDVRKWYASKMQPQKYGERLDLNVNQTVDLGQAIEAAKRRALPIRDLSNVVDAEIVETAQLPTPETTGSESVAESQDAGDSDPKDIFS